MKLELDRYRAEDRRRENENPRQHSGTQDPSGTSDSARSPRQESGDDERQYGERERHGTVSVRDLDEESGGSAHRGEGAEAIRPVIAATHPGAGDADDRTEHHLRVSEQQRQICKASD